MPLLSLLAARLYFWRLNPFAGEDAYITYRYSRNVVRGLGAVYNAREHVLGYTSPAWMAWNALGIALFKDPVVWSRATTIALELAALFFVAQMLERSAGRMSAWAFGIFYSGWTLFASTAMSGLESNALLAILGLSACAIDRRSALAGPLLGLIAVFRPEGVVLAAVAGLFARWRDRLIALAVAVPCYFALWTYYGSPVPQSLMAKAEIYGTPGPWLGRHWWEWVSPMALGRWPVTMEGGALFLMAVVAAPAAFEGVRTLARQWRDARGLASLAGSLLVVWAGYCLVGVAYFAWYLVLPLGAFAVLAAIGLPRITRGPWVATSMGLFVVGSWTLMPELYAARAAAEYQSFTRTAQVLGASAMKGQSVFLEPIGIVGWECNMRVIDEIGLVSPQVAKRRQRGRGWMTDTIRQERPDWLVTRRGVLEGANAGAAFAGRGQPFRDDAERRDVLAHYHLLSIIHPEAGEQAIEVRGLVLPGASSRENGSAAISPLARN